MRYELNCQYDTRKSFYGKAIVEETHNNNVADYKLYSYGTLVARVTEIGGVVQCFHFGSYSQTTGRHQKEFFMQFTSIGESAYKELKEKGIYTYTDDTIRARINEEV